MPRIIFPWQSLSLSRRRSNTEFATCVDIREFKMASANRIYLLCLDYAHGIIAGSWSYRFIYKYARNERDCSPRSIKYFYGTVGFLSECEV